MFGFYSAILKQLSNLFNMLDCIFIEIKMKFFFK
jgi:hypothetical protein